MSFDTKLQQLIINTLSPEQMPEVLSDTEIYLVEDDAEYATVEELATKQDVISDLSTIRTNASTGAGLVPQVAVNTQRIEDLTTAKFPNVVIIGTPHIEGGQVSNYSDTSYLQFPFVDISRGQPFDIYFSFTTSNDITTQQNILDSYFGIALAIQNGKGIMALSSNGQSWDIGMATGTNTLLPNTTYYVKYSWTGTQYNASLSLNDETYVPDMTLNSNLSPYKTTIFIGGSPNLFGAGTAHPFKGTINFNKSKVVVNNITVWEGMADVGLASRANVSLNNLDEVGEARFNAKQDTLVSGTNIKTVNGEDVLGEGDLKLSTYHPPLLSCMWSDHLLNDIQWLRADTFSWQDGDVYTTAYNTLVEEYATGTTETEGSVTFKRTANGYKIADASQEANILSKYNSDGIAWYYILDTENRSFKLPRIKHKYWKDFSVTLNKPTTLPVKGNGNLLGLQGANGTGGLAHIRNYWLGACTSTNAKIGTSITTASDSTFTPQTAIGVTTTASNSGIVADPSALSVTTTKSVEETGFYLYFYVGEYAQTAIEQTAGLNAEMFNNKLDLTGGTMTGQLKIENSEIISKRTDLSRGETTAPTSHQYFSSYGAFDKNDKVVGYFRTRLSSDNIYQSQMGIARVVNGTKTEKTITIGIDENGKISYSPVQLIKTYVSSNSGYNIWSNGYCEQWGVRIFTNNVTTITLAKTYKDTDYNRLAVSYGWTSTPSHYIVLGTATVNSFEMRSTATATMAGQWRTYGYLAEGQY